MNRTLLHTITLILIAASPILAAPAQAQSLIQLPTGFQYPNGITHSRDPIRLSSAASTLYVGSVTSGQILRITPNGKTETFFPGTDEIFAATSLRLDEQRGVLWGASPDFLGVRGADGQVTRRPHRIFAIDIRTAKVLQVIAMPDGGFSNDIALDENGGVYVTDSSRPRIHYLAPGTTQFRVWAEDEQFRSRQIGLGGIARAANGVLIVGMFSDGKLLKITPQAQGNPKVEAIPLPRSLENPDGMQFAPDGSLLITEGAVSSGNGRLLRIRNILDTKTPKEIETLASGLESPVNLTIAGQTIWITESRIRHRLLPGKEAAVPNTFFVRRFAL
ncbi:gluconolaconase [Leptolyngbya sp. FACHB-321]|uniref:Vgb family protein n=1 Tax=Leptolyngbya sp. FACHB-321 TaxID=2692807 RepID=UPI001682551A|nr:gluconolaconase [Leptolyngbya sp. FACHB-321]MBD2034485.1 gluconolaconase [Leptolyngbya sp. FACHB-321]